MESELTDIQKLIRCWYTNKHIYAMCQYFFKFAPTKRQRELIEAILYSKYPRMLVSAYTQYGKTKCISLGVCLYIIFNKNKEVFIVSSLDAKSKNVRNMMMENIIESPFLSNLLMTEAKGKEKLLKEVSKKRMTFKNGCIVQFFSAEGDGQRLMGFGIGKGGKLVIDEIAEIKREVVNTKIIRMMGAASDTTQFIAMFNPWSKDTAAYDMWLDTEYYNFHIDYTTGVIENRLTESFIEERRRNLFDWEFTILYESNFPDMMSDGIFNFRDLEWAYSNHDEQLRKQYENPLRIVACDVAAYGADLTVILVLEKDQATNMFRVIEINHYAKQSTVVTTDRIEDAIKLYKPDYVNVDNGGMGVAVCDMLIDRGYDVTRVNFGGCSSNDRYLNLKANIYFQLKELFQERRISVPKHPQLIKELSAMRWELTGQHKVKIIDPEKSPDYSDTLAIAVVQECVGQSYGLLEDFEL